VRRILLIGAALLLLGLAASVYVADGALHIYLRPSPNNSLAQAVADATSSNWEPAETTAPDGIALRGWIFTPRSPNGSAVILLHGVSDTRKGVLNHAEYLLKAGFTMLTPDSRGHGVSGGDYITYGVKEAADVHAWSDWLFAHRPIQRLYGMGESMGAAIILQSLATEPRYRAVVAECPYATFLEVAYDRLSTPAFPPHFTLWPTIETGYIYARLRYGVDLHLASPLAAVRATKVPVLLIHGTADTNIPPRNSQELCAANPAATTLWLVPGATHVNALSVNPELYIHTVLAWFRDHP
jgi:alpha-beta hydrolase superfamily lysophospholipase